MTTDKGNLLISEFMGLSIFYNVWERHNKNEYTGHPAIIANDTINFFDYKTDEFFGNELVRCFDSKKHKNVMIDNYYDGYFKYHLSWDALMPVCKRIIEMYFDKRSEIFTGLMNCDIDKTWREVVEFILFWNDDSELKYIWANSPVHEQQQKWASHPENSKVKAPL